ncbi:MAG: hypothetical protein BM485_17815 [Desulfobulbaceae bacterium DB1]|nr:MAG: hypothetical protein BM485_17815 [Desulfobulbaceae bacterium DB1]
MREARGERRGAGVGSQESGVGSRESGVGSQESGVGSQESGVRSQESGEKSNRKAERHKDIFIVKRQVSFAASRAGVKIVNDVGRQSLADSHFGGKGFPPYPTTAGKTESRSAFLCRHQFRRERIPALPSTTAGKTESRSAFLCRHPFRRERIPALPHTRGKTEIRSAIPCRHRHQAKKKPCARQGFLQTTN